MTRRDFLKAFILGAATIACGAGINTLDAATRAIVESERLEGIWTARLIRRAHGRASRESCARAAQTLIRWRYVR